VLDDPGGLEIRFGASVIDDGPNHPDPARRFKFGWFWGGVTDPPTGGLMVAFSPDGLTWTPAAPAPPVLPHTHDINNIYHDRARNRYLATVSMLVQRPGWTSKRRVPYQAESADLVHWSQPWQVLAPDDRDAGELQFYAMSGYLQRGPLLIGLVKVLRDDLPAEPGGEARGIGYTTLAWTRDGRHWQRDREPFLDRNPTPGTWDRAMAWADCQLPVGGDEVFIYYGGYARGHKVERFTERQIGLARLPRDRYVARRAGDAEGRLQTPPVLLDGSALTLNAAAADDGGAIRARVLDASGRPLDGFDFPDIAAPIRGDFLAHPLRWKRPLTDLRGHPVRLEFVLRRAALYALDVSEK
jgi:hypothetical protein